jgi:hypothetical protein
LDADALQQHKQAKQLEEHQQQQRQYFSSLLHSPSSSPLASTPLHNTSTINAPDTTPASSSPSTSTSTSTSTTTTTMSRYLSSYYSNSFGDRTAPPRQHIAFQSEEEAVLCMQRLYRKFRAQKKMREIGVLSLTATMRNATL